MPGCHWMQALVQSGSIGLRQREREIASFRYILIVNIQYALTGMIQLPCRDIYAGIVVTEFCAI